MRHLPLAFALIGFLSACESPRVKLRRLERIQAVACATNAPTPEIAAVDSALAHTLIAFWPHEVDSLRATGQTHLADSIQAADSVRMTDRLACDNATRDLTIFLAGR